MAARNVIVPTLPLLLRVDLVLAILGLMWIRDVFLNEFGESAFGRHQLSVRSDFGDLAIEHLRGKAESKRWSARLKREARGKAERDER